MLLFVNSKTFALGRFLPLTLLHSRQRFCPINILEPLLEPLLEPFWQQALNRF